MVEPVADPRSEALARVDGRYDVRVLEPSPPAVAGPPWFADDPVQDASAPGRPVLAPVPLGGTSSTWDELARNDPTLASWCAERWLGAYRPLAAPADTDALEHTRASWHTLAEHVLAPARFQVNGKIGLRFTRGGFGTPFFGGGVQVRVAAEGMVVVRDATVMVHPISTVAAAAGLLGIEAGAPTGVYTPTTSFEPDRALEIDPQAANFLGEWFGFGASVLEALRVDVPVADDPARVQLWPEHFDLSVDFGDDASGRRATYGASPGDAAHELPYLYVTPWSSPTGDFWNEGAYASLGFDELAVASDQRGAARSFFDRATEVLGS